MQPTVTRKWELLARVSRAGNSLCGKDKIYIETYMVESAVDLSITIFQIGFRMKARFYRESNYQMVIFPKLLKIDG
jgi:hypothetical protein